MCILKAREAAGAGMAPVRAPVLAPQAVAAAVTPPAATKACKCTRSVSTQP